MLNVPLFFVHIPKTAGTSFTEAALRAFGAERCQYDYGVGNRHTTALVADSAHRQGDLFRLQRQLAKSEAALFGGHVPRSQYAALFPSTRVVSFVREPLAQLLSHHAHICRAEGEVPLAKFIHLPRGAGLQGRMLDGAPLEALGVIGVTERYADSLRLINAAYGVDLVPLRENLNPKRTEGMIDYPALDAALAAQLDRLLALDRQLHARANALLDARLAALHADQQFVNGAISELTAQWVRGFAFVAEQPQRVKVQVLVNGEPVAAVEACRLRPDLRALNVPRNGCVGVEHRFAPALQPGDVVELLAGPAAQSLGRHRLPA